MHLVNDRGKGFLAGITAAAHFERVAGGDTTRCPSGWWDEAKLLWLPTGGSSEFFPNWPQDRRTVSRWWLSPGEPRAVDIVRHVSGVADGAPTPILASDTSTVAFA